MRKLFKYIATFIYHPIVCTKLYAKGGVKGLIILPQITINTTNGLYLGENVYIGRNSRFLLVKSYKGNLYNSTIRIGNNVTIGNRFSALSGAPINIGDDSLLASDILITSENHGIDPEISASYADNPLVVAPVNIGRGVWIGEKAIILPGAELGDKCVVAAGAVVIGSFPAYSMIAGIPARIIKKYNPKTHKWEKER